MNGQLKVLQVVGRSVGGISQHVHLLCRLLTGAGIEVTVAQPEANPPVGHAGVQEFSLLISNRPSKGDRRTIRRLRELAPNFDTVQAHGLRAGALSALALRKISKPARPRFIVTLHNKTIGSAPARIIGDRLLRIICRHADVVLGVSLDLVEQAKGHGAKATRFALIATPESGRPSRSREAIRNDLGIKTALCFVTIARLAPQKGLDMLIEATGHMEFDDYTWLVAGEGPLRGELEAAAQGTPVVFLGARPDTADLLQAADVVVSSSIWEGQPVALQEALRAGVPLVATAVGGTPAVVGEAALLVSPSAAALAAALDKVSSDADLRTVLHEAALKRAQQLSTPEHMLAQITGILRG